MSITPAQLNWDGTQPRAAQFNDIYHSADGIAESNRVFLAPSNIAVQTRSRPRLCVAELGFGTGLNFAVCAQHILDNSSSTQLRFISFEKYPLNAADWTKVCKLHKSELAIYGEMQNQPLPLLPGWHQRTFANGRIILSVFHGDVSTGLTDLVNRQRNPVTAWFLDGFAPAKNPQMWHEDIYQKMAQLSAQDTSVTTFTAAGHVRRGLQQVGFAMRKVDQQPFKRESLAGLFKHPGQNPLYDPVRSVCIHGAGLAGAVLARHLAESGVSVEVFDPNGPASGASAIEAAVLHSRLLGDGSPTAELRSSAFHYAAHYLSRFSGFHRTGVVQLQGPNLDATKLAKIATSYDAQNQGSGHWIQRLTQAQASQLSGTDITGDSLYFPTAGFVDTPTLCAQLLDHTNIDVSNQSSPIRKALPNVICAASATRTFPGCNLLEISDVHGQLDCYRATPNPIKLPLVGNGYVVPRGTEVILGATYEYKPWSRQQALDHNLTLNKHLLGETNLVWQKSLRGARCVASDRLPIVGHFAQGEKLPEGIWLCTAFGSMGTTAGPLAAALLSAQISGWLPPVNPSVSHLLRPQRFAERQARRGIRHISAKPTQ